MEAGRTPLRGGRGPTLSAGFAGRLRASSRCASGYQALPTRFIRHCRRVFCFVFVWRLRRHEDCTKLRRLRRFCHCTRQLLQGPLAAKAGAASKMHTVPPLRPGLEPPLPRLGPAAALAPHLRPPELGPYDPDLPKQTTVPLPLLRCVHPLSLPTSQNTLPLNVRFHPLSAPIRHTNQSQRESQQVEPLSTATGERRCLSCLSCLSLRLPCAPAVKHAQRTSDRDLRRSAISPARLAAIDPPVRSACAATTHWPS